MCDAVINNYQLFYSYENLVQKHEKFGNAMFFSWFLDKVLEMSSHFPFQHILMLMCYCWSNFGNECAEQWPNF